MLSNLIGLLCLGALITFPAGEPSDPDLLSTIRLLDDAQTANEARFPAGSVQYNLMKEQKESGVSSFEFVDAKVEWKAECFHTKLTRYGPSPKKIDTNDPLIPRRYEEYIINKTQFVAYFQKNQVYIATITDRNLATEQHISPKDYWYSSGLGDNIPCIKLFKKLAFSERNHTSSAVTLNHSIKDKVSLIYRDSSTNEQLKAIFSPRLDGNVTSFEYENGRDFVKKVKNFWSDADGKPVYLKRREEFRAIAREGQSSEVSIVYSTINFEPDYLAVSSSFTLDGLELPPGVLINDDLKKQVYRLGEASPRTVFLSIDRLAESMRLRGFASPVK